MREIEDVLLERWCRRGDARALGELFDAAAPRLLKLAIHLGGDPVEAEDLVQATFVAAIEQRERIDVTRSAMPWLAGVLAHKAQQLRRERARPIDPERLVERAQPEVGAALERRELDGEVAKALDRVGEPYRQVLLLRLRHGLAVPDIAHVLERDPGTVRVQLHRGLERLRALLPATLASALLVGSLAPRGLAAVKAEVLGAAELAAGVSWSIVGGVVMGKLVVAVVAVVLAAIVWFASGLGTSDPAEPEAQDIARRATAPAIGGAAASAGAPVAPEAEADRAAVSTPETSGELLRGVVLDAETGAPLAGARVRLFASREAFALDLVRELPELYEIGGKGELVSRTRGDWPRIEASGPSRFGRERVRVHDRPEPGQEPLAEAITTSEGRFELRLEAQSAVLECALDGYATRWRVADAGADERRIELWREREVRGIARTTSGPAGGAEIALRSIRVVGHSRIAAEIPIETIGAWRAVSGPDGRFTAHVGADEVLVAATARGASTPQWDATKHPVESEIEILLRPAPLFHFIDAEDGRPVERVVLVAREQGDGYLKLSGAFAAPNGYWQVPAYSLLSGFAGMSTVALQAWAEGYEPTSCPGVPPGSGPLIEVSMRRDRATAPLEGIVRLGSAPLAGAEVALVVRSHSWRFNEDWLVDAVRTADDGSFRLSAPRGSYLLRILREPGPFQRNVPSPTSDTMWFECPIPGKEPWIQPIEVPCDPLVIDLAQGAGIRVSVVGTAGEPRPQHLVALSDASGRANTQLTDDLGVVAFRNLVAGEYEVLAPFGDRVGSFVGGSEEKIELAPGETRDVRIVRPAPGEPRYARAISAEVTSFEGWRATSMYMEEVRLEPDGVIPLDLSKAPTQITIDAPGRRSSWRIEVPPDAPDGHEIRLETGEGVYRGELLGADGAGLASVVVVARPQGSQSRRSVAAKTDADGRFELRGLASADHGLSFEVPDSSPLAAGLRLKWFRPSAAPAREGTSLSIRIGTAYESVRLRGTLRDARGDPLAGARVQVRMEEPQASGTLRWWSSGTSDAAGRFEIDAQRAPEVALLVWPGVRPSGEAALVRPLGAGELASPLEIVVD